MDKDTIRNIVCKESKVSYSRIVSKCRNRDIIIARTIYIVLARKYYTTNDGICKECNLSRHGYKQAIIRYENDYKSDFSFKTLVDRINHKIKGYDQL